MATILLYSPGVDSFPEDLANLADCVFYFEEGPRDSSQTDGQDLAEDEGTSGHWKHSHDQV
ncbi:MAG: hypothetical protein MUO26_07765 [Methanotrichaceae archaeon]|nr:hypothetical protein [Methanotrichaceae archaeon]